MRTDVATDCMLAIINTAVYVRVSIMAYMGELDFGIRGFKRSGNACPSEYSLCPSHLGGGCCPSTLSCGTSSCYGTMTSPLAACPITGYVACGIQEGGGCCPSGYQCDRNGCVAPTGTSVSTAIASCATGSFLCPASLDYGCCADGLSCDLTTCYETFTSTVSFTLTITSTDSASNVSTITTVMQTVYVPSTPTKTPTTSTPVAVSKIAASTTTGTATSTSTPSVGLTRSQHVGIIAGAIAGLLIVMLLAFMTFIILRRLNKAASQASGYSDGPLSHPDHKYTQQAADSSLEPLVTHEIHSDSVYRPTAAHPKETPWTNYISSQNLPPFYSSNAIGYTPLPESESDFRNPHVTPPLDGQERNISFGQPFVARRSNATSHGRQWSDVTVQSNLSNQSNESYELEATETERRGGLQRALADFRVMLSRKRSRRKSSLNPRGFLDTGELAKSLQVRLDDVAEGQRSEDGNNEGSQEAADH